MRARLNQHGFALPTILISSVVMLIVLTSAVSAAGSVRNALETQVYNQLAREAAESGLTLAFVCLRQNNYNAQWSTSSPLRPRVTCPGGTTCDSSNNNCELISVSNPGPPYTSSFYRTSFSVGTPTQQGNSQLVRARGWTDLIRPDGSVQRTYESNLTMRVGNSTSLGEINPIVFGY